MRNRTVLTSFHHRVVFFSVGELVEDFGVWVVEFVVVVAGFAFEFVAKVI